MKADDICASELRVADQLVERHFVQRRDYAYQTLIDFPYSTWRQYDPEDTLRFYALRMREGNLIKSNSTDLMAKGTDWRFFNELKRELKA